MVRIPPNPGEPKQLVSMTRSSRSWLKQQQQGGRVTPEPWDGCAVGVLTLIKSDDTVRVPLSVHRKGIPRLGCDATVNGVPGPLCPQVQEVASAIVIAFTCPPGNEITLRNVGVGGLGSGMERWGVLGPSPQSSPARGLEGAGSGLGCSGGEAAGGPGGLSQPGRGGRRDGGLAVATRQGGGDQDQRSVLGLRSQKWGREEE